MFRNALSQVARPALLRAPATRAFTSTGARALAPSAAFEKAQKDVTTLPEKPGNDVMLQLYALFKQASEGKNTKPQPSRFNFVDRAKWDAWAKLDSLSQADAEKQYIELVTKLLKAAGKA
ncbi:diazepam-binding inhibitor (GABA receptor modulator, acyl-CoA-binding protein) [Capsaspora owczarzaki ATCC 30864]|uniref:Diazepam-binding inhibitor (GABA receptor modulator, acyl-CoA-binding protein) n=1 Tax=Capsaspora owczarzaki (strain ATCC 30864) TaxID=595528 RepID=A0A0D2X3K5_CAPO3|nr:diazepam-binding inhibitor (GABA receptor modulator, acyl-CoA-binding protein) [Capsaspora owczarzaki ATCC 30864]